MRNDINVTNTIDIVLGNSRDIVVVAKRNWAMSSTSVRRLHLPMRRDFAGGLLAAPVGSLGTKKPRLATSPKQAYQGPARYRRCERRACSTSHASTTCRS